MNVKFAASNVTEIWMIAAGFRSQQIVSISGTIKRLVETVNMTTDWMMMTIVSVRTCGGAA